ncbi:MAG: 50S ribosomal protein L10 [Candidatus Schekmanbacteria bacterium]|nr:MAG: 50S ribosomal protein L10 [Candidatus Schekmanbacteria bacterium]
MKREEKEKVVSELKQKFEESQLGIFADYRGLNVKQMTELRKKLKEAGSEMKVVKNTLARLASKGTKFEKLEDYLEGPIGFTFCYDDPVAPAKVLVDFSDENPSLELKGGIWDDKVISIEEIKQLSKVPPREVLLSRMLSSMKAPVSRTVNVLGGVLIKFMNVLKAIEENKK